MMKANNARWFIGVFASLAGLYLVHLIPEPDQPQPLGAGKSQFQWQRDAYWQQLEFDFKQSRSTGCAALEPMIADGLTHLQAQLTTLADTNLTAEAEWFDGFETNFFQLGPQIAACPERLDDYLTVFNQMRSLVKRQSRQWAMDSVAARERLYRTVYGGRAAIEEMLLQTSGEQSPLVMLGDDEPSAAPGAEVRGVILHSGDILVSRGGAATSALIARGNDFTGNFSHVALVHVDEETRAVSVIESHIESGVGVFPIERYLSDTKLRIMVLRLRSDLSAIASNPRLPHDAATWARAEAQRRHIPYDFAMDFRDPAKQFCSEVVSAAYGEFGVSLWMGMSHLSTPGVTAWLSTLGVRHFETQEPSDLEYDPQLAVVAEWRDPETLLKDHVDNAVIDVLLEGAEAGEELTYNHWLLPMARGLKAWSVIKNQFGAVGPIPEGMSATTALRVDRFTMRHQQVADRVLAGVAVFEAEQGYVPPYWELLRMAREALDE